MSIVDQSSAVFRIENLSINFPAKRHPVASPLQGLNLTIHANQITTILGQSGCGKSTLLNALGGFVIGEDSGGVLYRQRYMNGPLEEIVMIFQENNLYPWLSVAGNVKFGLRFRNHEGADVNKTVRHMLDSVGLSEAAGSFPHQLSGGMRQRTAIARALITRPKVLLLDEPFSALDISLKRRMHGLLRSLQEETGTSMVMVTHDVEEAITVGDRVLVLGGNPAQVLVDADTSSDAMRDRYSSDYLRLQKEIEDVIY
jgi:ABC-type nitrate/sulfonate/bicarbonate transport system ATPase subunit